MRTRIAKSKAFVMSMGLAASVWLTGCQSNSQLKIASHQKSSNAVACKDGSCTASSKTETSAKTVSLRTANRKVSSAVPAAACSTGTCDKTAAAETNRKEKTTAAADCNTCDPKTAKTAPPPAIASLPIQGEASLTPPPGTDLVPPPLTNVAKTAPNAPTVVEVVSPPSLPETSGYGPGVEVVSAPSINATPVSITESPAKENVMSVTFGQANDYKVIVGQVYQFRRAWKLRYAAVESEDKYGGSVTLVGENLDNLRDGQMVRVEGMVLASDDRAGGARYQVNRVEPIEPNLK